MTTRTLDAFKALVLILSALFLVDKIASGRLYYYIGPRFAWLSVVAVLLLIALASAYTRTLNQPTAEAHEHRHSDDHDHAEERPSIWPLLLMALPIVLGTLVPSRPLGASAVSNRGVVTEAPLAASSATSRSLTLVPNAGPRDILDWVMALGDGSDPAAVQGQEADVTGFVYRDPRFAADQFMVSRFMLTCCVADAMAVGLIVQHPDAAQLATDGWVRVQGTFGVGSLGERTVPVLQASSLTPVDPPERPYLYP